MNKKRIADAQEQSAIITGQKLKIESDVFLIKSKLEMLHHYTHLSPKDLKSYQRQLFESLKSISSVSMRPVEVRPNKHQKDMKDNSLDLEELRTCGEVHNIDDGLDSV